MNEEPVAASPASTDHRSTGRIRRVTEGTKQRYKTTSARVTEGAMHRYRGTSAETLWNRLNSMDFINAGMVFASTLLLCFFPFMIVVNALAGRGTVGSLARRLGLNQRATADMSRVFASTHATTSAITGASWVLFVLGGVAVATALQQLYERMFDVKSRGMKDIPYRFFWLGFFVGSSFFAGWAWPGLRHSIGPVLLVVLAVVVYSAFWWFSLWVLLVGRVHWRYLIPAAVATAVFWVGMHIVFSLIFSGQVTSDYKEYGAVGVVFALMSYFIAIGVVIILGAAVGIVWRERELSFARAYVYLRRRGARPTGR